jgi:SAM-dependent methyltransferase
LDAGNRILSDTPRREPVDKDWDDAGVIPEELTPDTVYLFARMTEETLRAVDIHPGEKILDVGCGQGLDLISQKSRDAALFGSDGSLVMIRKASRNFFRNGLPLLLVCGSAEHLPMGDQSFDKVYCKGAIDHFYNPWQALLEMLRVLKPHGCLVIAVANFASLSCKLGRLYHLGHRRLKGRDLPKPHFWDLPEDHVFKFDHPFLTGLLPQHLNPDWDRGISMLWGLPRWARFLKALPTNIRNRVLRGLDRVARMIPSLADVIVIRVQRVPSSESGPLRPSTGPC